MPSQQQFLPLSFSQQRLWFIDQLEPGGSAYNIARAIRIRGQLDLRVLQQSLQAIVSRHDSLRTVFASIDGTPVARVQEPGSFTLSVLDSIGLEPVERGSGVTGLAREEARRPFDLEKGPLFRATLLCLGEKNYLLLLTLHHIISDGWSMGVLARELASLYEAFAAGNPSPLPNLPIQYAEYAQWQRNWLIGEALEKQLSYWRKQLDGCPTALSIPTDRPRPGIQTSAGARECMELSKPLTKAVKAFSQREGLTLYITLLAAFKALLHRYSGEADIVVGSPAANRNRRDVEGLIGFFINSLVLRTDLSGDPPFREVLARVRKVARDAYAFQDLPFEKLVDELQPERSLSRNPLFQVVFALQNTPNLAFSLPGLTLIPEEIDSGTAKFDLFLSVEERDGGLKGYLEYNTDLFDAPGIQRMLQRFQILLSNAIERPDRRLSRLPWFSPGERQQLLVDWNQTGAGYDRQSCVPQLVAHQAAERPEALAVVCGLERLSYTQLNGQANQLAHQLAQLGVGPEVRVAVCLESSGRLIVGLLGVLKAGGAYVPLDPAYPPERLRFMLEDARGGVLLTEQKWLGAFSAWAGAEPGRSILLLDRDWELIRQQSSEEPMCAVRAEQLAYVIYTSGSTGRPKGVEITHRSLLNLVCWHQRAYEISASDRASQLAGVGFDACVWELWPYLSCGAAIYVAGERERSSAQWLRDWLVKQELSVSFVPTPLAEAVLELEWPKEAGLRKMLTGGDRLREYAPAGLGFELINHYGPTESTVVATCAAVPSKGAGVGGPPIGRPIANTKAYLLDRYMEPVPVGVAGELYIGGDGLARGYSGRAELTAEKFVCDPFGEEPGSRLYRTGDLCRYRADGQIEFLGRLDQQVKIRGYRIELGEIESVLGGYAGVKDAVVVVREEGAGDKRLVGYVVRQAGAQIGVEELRDYLKAKLPDYMVPGQWVMLAALPLNANGKVDRRALPSPEDSRSEKSFVAPRNTVETILACIWSDVLKMERVGIHDNFFELGGDSILTIKIISRAAHAGVHLTPRQLFQYQTIFELAKTASASIRVEAEQGLVVGSVPLTPIQHWFFEQKLQQPHHFNMAMQLELKEAHSPAILGQALEHLLAHHDLLRSRFVRGGTDWEQVIGPSEKCEILVFLDLSGLAEETQQAAFESAAAELQASLDLSKGPVVRAALFQLGATRPARLLIVIHHLVMDGVSWQILLEDLQTAVAQLNQNISVQLPAKTSSFQHWSKCLQEYGESEELQNELDYWLADERRVACSLPVDRAGTAEDNTWGCARTVSVSLTEAETGALLKDVPKAYNTQINEVLLTALAQALGSWIKENSCSIELEGHGREEIFEGVDLSRTLGWFTTTYPVLLPASNSGIGDALKSTKERLRRIPNRGLGYGVLRYLGQDAAAVERLKSLPRPGVSFNYRGQVDNLLTESGLFSSAAESTRSALSPSTGRQHLLDISGRVANGRLSLDWIYCERIHHCETIEALAAHFLASLRGLIIHCLSSEAGGFTPSDFPLASLDQRWLDGLILAGRNIERIYPLSPMQQGMFFHSLYSPESPVYFVQALWMLKGNLDGKVFRQSWERLLDHHSVLRTSFLWEGLAEPLQIVQQKVSLEWKDVDWRDLSPAEKREKLESFLLRDRKRCFDLDRPPLMRATLARWDENCYQFILSFHHLLLDGWCLPLLLKDVSAFYQALTTGEEAQLEPPRPYQDFIAWLQTQDLHEAEAFWRNALQGFAAPTPLYEDRVVAGSATNMRAQAEQQIKFPERISSGIQSFARQHQLTVNTVFQGVWALLLSHYARQTEVLFGVTVSGRPASLPDVESMVGLFINTLPLHVRLAPEQPLVPWLKRLQEMQLEMRQYEYSPLVKAQEWSELPSGLRLFDSLLAFENYPDLSSLWSRMGSLQFDDLRMFDQTNLPLTLILLPGREFILLIKYDRDRFNDSTIHRMLRHWQALLESIVANPNRALSEFAWFTEIERKQLLVEWNQTAADYPKSQSIYQLFELQALRCPDAQAVVSGSEQVSYKELNERANQLAGYLRSLGVGAGSLVGLCMERSVEMVVGLLGILKAGAAYVPLEPTYPQERLEFMVADTGLRVLLSQSQCEQRLPELPAVQVVYLDRQWELISQQSKDNGARVSGPEELAYVMYTSGSSGRPKGVGVVHRGVVRLVFGVEYMELRAGESFLQLAPICFDASTLELWGALLHGGRCVLWTGAVPSARELGQALKTYQVSTLWLTASLFNAVVDEELEALAGLKQLLIGGEALSVSHVRRAVQGLKGTQLINGYGPTEGTTFSCCYRIGPEMGEGLKSIPIGRPISNTRVYILDGQFHAVPVGVAGELYIGGDGLARGYWDRPELTAEKFVCDPFGEEPGSRLYRTGDLCRYRADGQIEFLGRVDQQVKIRGFRIELGEIESVLGGYAGVKDAVVVVKEEPAGDKRLVGYVARQAGAQIGVEELRSYLKAKLPDYMVPGQWVLLEALPLNANGKVDRRALPEPNESGGEPGTSFVGPRSPIEEMLTSIWSEVLHLERVSVHDNFFEIGGHSLLATQLASRVRENFQVEIPLRTLFDAPTVAELALSIENLRQVDEKKTAPPILRQSRTKGLPLSFAQQRLWFLDQFDLSTSVYNLPAALRIRGTLDVKALEKGLTEIVRRHESLRTAFVATHGQPTQVIGSGQEFSLRIVDLSDLPLPERGAAAAREAKAEAQKRFDLAKGPLFRASLLKLDQEEYNLLLTMHHIISDGWSLGVLFRELETLYTAFRRGGVSPLLEMPVQYADFACWQRDWLQGEVLGAQLAYWKKQLAGSLPFLELPTDWPRPPVQTFRGARQALVLTKSLSHQLKKLSRSEGVTLFMTLLSAFKIWLARLTGQTDVSVGIPIAGRNRFQTEALIGFFVNTVVLRTEISGRATFRELLRQVRDVALGAYVHQDLPFEKLVEELSPDRSLSHNPLFQVMFNMVNFQDNQLHLSGLSVETLANPEAESKFDLTLYAAESPEGIHFIAVYNASLFESSRMAEMLQQMQHLLTQIVEDPLQRISALSLLSPTAKLVLPNPGDVYAKRWDGSVHARFSEQALRVPEKIAVEDNHGAWNYRELELASNRLANLLREAGIRPGHIVAIYAHRSAPLVLALLGLLKSGAAFVILDPAYPCSRLIDCLRLARPQGWIQLESAGPLPDPLHTYAGSLPCRIELPARLGEIGALHGISGQHPGLITKPEDRCYIAFTSGSTGRPRGIVGTHSPLSHFLQWHTQTFGLSENDRFSMLSGLSHDPLLRDIFTPLWLGATLCIPEAEDLAHGQLAGWMRERRISVTHLTPPMSQLLGRVSRDPGPGSSRGETVPCLSHVFFGGDTLTMDEVAKVRAVAPSATCINFYGATETPQAMGYYVVPDSPDRSSTSPAVTERARVKVPLGRGIREVDLLVLNESLQLAGIGELGEIHVHTPYLTEGYVADDALTRERFIANPFAGAAGDHLYKTGDQGRYLSDGNVEFVGRNDRQVKVRGFRVELGEIEAAVSQHPAVRDSVVILREDAPGDKRLVAYVVFDQIPGPTFGELRDFLWPRVPEYMIPSGLVVLNAIPLTSNGKVHFQALPVPERIEENRAISYLAPRTPIEEDLCRIWAQFLPESQVGVHDNFFELGGHSLLATQIISRIRDEFDVKLPLRSLFETPTIADQALLVTQLLAEGEGGQSVEEMLGEIERMSAEELSAELKCNRQRAVRSDT